MCEPNDFCLIWGVFTFWFDGESIIPCNFGFAISVCRLRERGRMSKSKSMYVRVLFLSIKVFEFKFECALSRKGTL